ncbi:hypothetical protein LCL95_05350 [Bacillus timonensis]|nr:hypothetical protein [Bacillus timonensis]
MKKDRAIPNFDQLNDRIIAKASDEPRLVIKTNMDPQDSNEENPYTNDAKNSTPSQKFQDFFDGN